MNGYNIIIEATAEGDWAQRAQLLRQVKDVLAFMGVKVVHTNTTRLVMGVAIENDAT